MQMAADDQFAVDGIQMTAVQDAERRVPPGQRRGNGVLWDYTPPSAVSAFTTANFSFVKESYKN